MKRLIDVIFSILMLCVCSPFIIVTAIIIFVFIGKPIMFTQVRPGIDGIPFKIYKFRTMSNAIDSNGNLLSDEDRLSKVGMIIRKLSLDELPQLLNVLKGDISLVGPRPLLIEYLPLYSEYQNKRHSVKPGITGWAQVNGRNAITWKKKFELDVWYVENQSISLDFKILFMTIKKVIFKENVSSTNHVTMEKFNGNN